MKKRLFCLVAVMLALFFMTACEKESDYEPSFAVGEGYTLNGDVISGKVIGEEYIDLFSVFTTYEDFIIFGDSTAEAYLESGIIPLKKGNNHLVVRFMRDGAEREYDLEIEYIPIRSFSVSFVNQEKTYHIGEKFDKSTILVSAVTEGGETIPVEKYDAEYAFSELGESDVGIELGGMYESLTVMVTEEYLPTLDGDFSADGVFYVLRGEEAVLLSAEEADGFFAVPRAVIYKDKEYAVTEIANGAFSRTSITSVLIPEGVKKLSASVFLGCAALDSIELPETVETIGRQAFSGCVSLSRAELPEGLEALEYGAFSDCESLFRITLPASLKSIGEEAFSGCKTLKTVNFSRELTEIGANAFSGCEALSTVILPNLEYIGAGAFQNCRSLSVCAIADAVSIDETAFVGTEVTLYTSMTGRVLAYAASASIPYVIVSEEEPCLVRLPEAFAIEEEYPYADVLALVLLEDQMSALKNYEVTYDSDACGYLTATLTWGNFSHSYTIFVSYTETVLTDTDTRGARYELDPIQKTAVLVFLPEYVRPGKVYESRSEELFIVPTALSCPDGLYTVVGVKEGILDGCQNASSLFIPQMTKTE